MAIRFINTGEKATSYYRTSDGNLHSTKSAAEAHEASTNPSSGSTSSSSTQTETRTTGDEALQETAELLTGADNMRLDDGQGAQQQQQAPAVNAADIVEVRGMSLAEAEAELRGKKGGATPHMLANIKRAEEMGDAKLVASYRRQFNSLIESYAKNSSVAVNTQTGEVLHSTDNRWANRSIIGGVEGYLKSKVVPKLAIKMEVDRILADSNTIGAEFSRVERYRGGYRAIGTDGSMGPRRDTEQEAIQSATKNNGWGQKVAETAEQKAQLIQLATRAIQFSDVTSFNANDRTNILQKALPGVNRTEVWRFATGIQKPVKYDPKTQKTYTTYGSGLTIELSGTQNGPQAMYNIVSPEGVRLDNFDFSTRQMLQYGISKEAVLAAGAKAEAAGLNPVANNKYTPLVYSLQNEVDPTLFTNHALYNNQVELLSKNVGRAFARGEGDLAARFEREKGAFQVDPSSNRSAADQFTDFKGNWFAQNYTGPKRVTLEEFVNSGGAMLEGLPEGMVDLGGGFSALGNDPMAGTEFSASFDDKGVMKSKYGQAARDSFNSAAYGVVNLAAPTADPTKQNEFTLPTWSIGSYTQELNNIYKTPNNNIQFGSNGLEYRFADGTTKTWGGNIENLNALPVMFGTEPVGGRQGELFKTAQKFDNAEEWGKWNTNYKTRFDSPSDGAVQAPTAPRPTADTDDLEATSNAVVQGGTPAVETQDDLPQTVSYELPQNYQGSGYTPNYQGQTGVGAQAPMTGTFTKPATTGMIDTAPSQPYYTGQQPSTPAPIDPGSVGYNVQTFTNPVGMTAGVTFTGGQPQTPVPSGFYPAPPAITAPQVTAPEVQAPTAPTAPQTQTPQSLIPRPVTANPTVPKMNKGGLMTKTYRKKGT